MTMMQALTFDRSREDWATSTGFVRETVAAPTLDEGADPADAERALLKVKFAGFCGSDRGIWTRKAFGDMILGSLDGEHRDKRIIGHEMLAEVVALGSRAGGKLRVGDVVSTESHIVCGVCVQCRKGQYHVCANDKIIGISQDGCFAEYLKLPVKALWKTDLGKIRPEVAAVQEPFGNAVHACQAADLRGASVAIFGTGTIGLFAVLIARGLGARQVIGVEPDPKNAALAKQLGADVVLTPARPPADAPWKSDPAIREQILALTDGVGVDVAMEMAGFNSSTNNAIKSVRRGGDVVLFGVKNGEAIFEDAHRIVMNGLNLHGIVGRRLFSTWETTQALLEDTSNGIQQAVWDVILNRGDGTIVDLATWERASFQGVLDRFTKPVIRVAG